MQARLDFDLLAAEHAKRQGMELAESHEGYRLSRARSIAENISRERGSVTADDVQEVLIENGLGLLGNAAGALFKGSQWVFTGEWRKSTRVSNHAHQNRVWRLKEGGKH